MHHTPVAEGDAAQAERQGAGRQALQLREGAAHLHVALLDAELRAAGMPEALRRAEVRAQRRMEGQLPDNILQPRERASPLHLVTWLSGMMAACRHGHTPATVGMHGGATWERAPADVCSVHRAQACWEACLPKAVHKQKVAPIRVLPGLEGHSSIALRSTPHTETHNALEKVSIGQDFGHAARNEQES